MHIPFSSRRPSLQSFNLGCERFDNGMNADNNNINSNAGIIYTPAEQSVAYIQT